MEYGSEVDRGNCGNLRLKTGDDPRVHRVLTATKEVFLFAMVWQALIETRTHRAIWKNVSARRKSTQKEEEGKQSQRIGIDWDGNGRVDKGAAARRPFGRRI